MLTCLNPRAEKRGKTWYGLYRCECGTEKVIRNGNVNQGSTISCGCLLAKALNRTTHGMSGTSTYTVWVDMKRRCYDPRRDCFKHYGGRGIEVCARWQAFENFLEDMGERPENFSLERIDNNGNYEPGNCKWATPLEQSNNKRTNNYLKYRGRVQSVSQWARELRIPKSTILQRVNDLGWDADKALSTLPNTKHKRKI